MSFRDWFKKAAGEKSDTTRDESNPRDALWRAAGFEGARDLPPHPLMGLDRDLLDCYLVLQCSMRDELRTQDDGRLLFMYRQSLGIEDSRWQELTEAVSLLDDVSFDEMRNRLRDGLDDDGMACFLCDMVRLHGERCDFNGDLREFFDGICKALFNLGDGRTRFLEGVCTRVAAGRPLSGIGSLPPTLCDYYSRLRIDDKDDGTYLVVDLSGKSGPRHTEDAPDLSDDACRTSELWLRRIPAGSFARDGFTANLTRDFYIAIFPTTQRQWELVMGGNPSHFRQSGPGAPVEQVSYDDICGRNAAWPRDNSVAPDSFLGRLRQRTGLEFDLPTDFQWEYAARSAGRDKCRYAGSDNINDVAWYGGNSGKTTHKVGQKCPNSLGLYDMSGNVWEWCRDWWGDDPSGIVTDPKGPQAGSIRVYRGGGWYCRAGSCESACRDCRTPGFRGYDLGFRLALVPV